MPGRGTPGFSGARLREARIARGLSAASLAEIAGVTRQLISQYEHGQTAPTPDTLYLLAARLNLPPDFFVQEARIPREQPIFFRALAAATKGERDKAESRLDWLDDLVTYLGRFVDFPVVELPRVEDVGRPWSDAMIEDAAQAVRQAWNLGDGPIPSVVGLLERHGVVVTRGIVETEALDAFSVRLVRDERPAVFLGADKDSASRSRFDAAHELGHHILHRNVSPRRLANPVERKSIEREAHRFASALLLPAREFARDLRAPTLAGMQLVKGRWLVSIGAMIQRCSDLEILRQDEAARLWMARARRGWARHEPLDDEIPFEQPAMLRQAVEIVVGEDVRAPRQLLDELRLSAADVEALAGLPDGFLSDSEAPTRLVERRAASSSPQPAQTADVIEFRGDTRRR